MSCGGEFLRLRGREGVWFREQWGLHPALSECSSEVSGPSGKAGGAPWGALSLPGVLSPQGSVNDTALRAAASTETGADGTLVVPTWADLWADTPKCPQRHETSASVSALRKRLNFPPDDRDGGLEPKGHAPHNINS